MILYFILKLDKSDGNIIQSVIDIYLEEEYADKECKRMNDLAEKKVKYKVKQFKAKGVIYE